MELKYRDRVQRFGEHESQKDNQLFCVFFTCGTKRGAEMEFAFNQNIAALHVKLSRTTESVFF